MVDGCLVECRLIHELSREEKGKLKTHASHPTSIGGCEGARCPIELRPKKPSETLQAEILAMVEHCSHNGRDRVLTKVVESRSHAGVVKPMSHSLPPGKWTGGQFGLQRWTGDREKARSPKLRSNKSRGLDPRLQHVD